MACRQIVLLAAFVLVAVTVVPTAESQLSPTFYDGQCREAVPLIREIVRDAVYRAPRLGAALLRLHFHDCFVSGCDASILLDGPNSEKTVGGNANMPAVMYELIDKIKWAVDQRCRRPVVSCADILAVAARDAVSALGGPYYEVQLGRRDGRVANRAGVSDLPVAGMTLQQLIQNFGARGLNLNDLVVLSGGHTVGFTKCRLTRMPNLADIFRQQCQSGGNADVSFDPTPYRFDNAYYQNLVAGRGVLQSDQELFKGDNSQSDKLVRQYSEDAYAHGRDFGQAMIKMGNIKPLTGYNGEIRRNCRMPNY